MKESKETKPAKVKEPKESKESNPAKVRRLLAGVRLSSNHSQLANVFARLREADEGDKDSHERWQ